MGTLNSPFSKTNKIQIGYKNLTKPTADDYCIFIQKKVDNFFQIWYRRDTYKKVYAPVIMPINGRNEWIPTGYIPPNPPNLGRDVGRPERASRRGKDEPARKTKKRSRGKPKILSSEFRLKRQQRSLKCSECGGEGHNKKSCGHNSTQGIQTTIENDQSTIHEEIVVSQYMVSQSSEYGGTVGEGNNEVGTSSSPPKLKVKGKGGEPNWQANLRSSKCFKPAPTPFEQLEECQVERVQNQGGKKKKKYMSLSQL